MIDCILANHNIEKNEHVKCANTKAYYWNAIERTLAGFEIMICITINKCKNSKPGKCVILM